MDPAGIENVGTVYHHADAPYDWTLVGQEAFLEGGKPLQFSRKNVFVRADSGGWERKRMDGGDKKDGDRGKVTSVNHANIPPNKDDEAGGVTFDYALQTVVLSLPALRRLRFTQRTDGAPFESGTRGDAEDAARTALAALALAAILLAQERGLDLRSRALLVPEMGTCPVLQLVPCDGAEPTSYALTSSQAMKLVNDAADAAKAQGLGWTRAPLMLKPMPKLVALIRESRRLAAASETDAGGVA